MIDTLHLANYLQNILNQNSRGLDFLVFADEGDLVATQKLKGVKKTYVHSLLEITSSTIIPIKNLTFHTINAQLMILADITDAGFVEETDKKRKQSRNLILIKECVAELIKVLNGNTVPLNDEDKTYNAVFSVSRPTDGQKDSLGDITEFLPLYVNIGVNVFENGINTNQVSLKLNHENIHFTRMVLSKTKTADQNNFAKDKASKTFALIGGKGIDIITPVLDSAFSKFVMEDVLNDDTLNRAVDVRLETPIGTTQFIGILGNTQISGDVGANLGYNISLVQGVERVLKYDENWQKINVPATTTKYTINMLNEGTIYWGDGTSDYVTEASRVEHVYTDGKAHTIYKYGG